MKLPRLLPSSLLLLGLVADALALSGVFGLVSLSKGEAIGLHMLGVLLGLWGFLGWFPEGYRKRWVTGSALILAFTLPLPFVGIAGLVVFRLLLETRPVDDLNSRYVLGERQFLTFQRPELAFRKSQQSILEVLSSRNNSLRRTAILALRAVEPKKSLPVLIKAIADSDEQVRLLAQTQFNKIIANLELTIKKMEAEIKEGEISAKSCIGLAEQYHELVYLGLSSEETEQLYLTRAIELLQKALELEPQHNGARFFLLKCLIKRGLGEQAERCLEELRQAGFQEEFLRVWRADIQFQRRDYASLRKTLEEMRQAKSTDPRLSGLIEFWLGNSGLQGVK
jgi:polysaccharide biosynthesis protein PelE